MDTNEYKAKVPKYGNLFYRKENLAYTHNGTFHADDVCSSALLEIAFPGIRIIRVPNVPENAELAFDIGCGKFDHHQDVVDSRPDGTKYASFGLLWREIGPTILPIESVKLFDDVFVKQIDYTDNTGYPNPFSSVIKAFNPSWQEESKVDEKFREAVDFAKQSIIYQFNRYKSARSADDLVKEMMSDQSNYPTPHALLMDQYMPYHKHVVPSDIYFIVYPSNRNPGGWNINCVPTEIGGKKPKLQFPEGWVKNPPYGCTFMNMPRTIACFKSREDAIAVLDKLEKMIGSNANQS